MFKNSSNAGVIQECRISPIAPPITHLLFADDNFLFFKTTTEESTSIKQIINSYELFSRQAVNFQKSGIFFSSNVRGISKMS